MSPLMEEHVKTVTALIERQMNAKRAQNMTREEVMTVIDANLKDCMLIGPNEGAALRAMVYGA